MASLVLSAIGTAIGGPIGGAIGTFLGSLIDRAAISALTPGPPTQYNKGAQLSEIQLTTSTEGASLTRLYGRARLGGQLIWTTQFNETVQTTTTKVKTGGKGGGKSQRVVTTTYKYSLSFAIAFCEGTGKAVLGRVWIDGKEADLSKFTFRFYPGSASQAPDPKIQAVEGSTSVPAYRNVVYLVFEDLPLEDFGNRMPQVTAEIVNPLYTTDPDDLSNIARSFTMIPSSGESIYGTQQYNVVTGGVVGINATTKPDNVHNSFRLPDSVVSLDQLVRNQNNLDAISLTVAWFGTDLRADQCLVIPKTEDPGRIMLPTDWAVNSFNHSNAQRVSLDAQGRPLFGGTPSDSTVTEMIQYIRGTLGKRCVFYPFLMMDIPSGNTLPNPYSNGAAGVGQPSFPWRGRITCSPAIGYSGTPDKSATAATQINTFFTRTDGYRRMILHYANLCVAAGGVDAFLIGSELVGITTVRQASGAGPYPGVVALATLAADVKAIFAAAGMSSIKVGYGADWSEYHSHRPADGTNDVIFNMDPLWSSSGIDFIGIDNYLPISDWRDGSGHLDYNATTGPTVLHDPTYLASNVEGGEYYNWYYASAAARDSQTRTTITDATYGKPWVFRQKDIRNWWSNQHYNRPGGVQSGSPTSYVASGKPIWFTEFGCPAVDKGTNQPNVFYDPKSSESFFPYYSKGTRDDFIQRLYAEVVLKYWRDNAPTSGVYGGPMVSTANMFIWTWDARPFPDYPARANVWSDGALWYYGHWMTGRIDAVPLARLVADLCQRGGLSAAQIDTKGLYGPGALVRGYAITSVSSPREMISTLADGYQFDSYESGGIVHFTLRSNVRTITLDGSQYVITDDDPVGINITRGQEADLPTAVKITFVDEFNDYQTASVDGKKGTGSSLNVSTMQLALVLNQDYVRSLADSIIHQAWVGREKGEVTLPPSYVRVDANDALILPIGNRQVGVRVTKIDVGEARKCEFMGFDTSLFTLPSYPTDTRVPLVSDLFGQANLEFVDVPLFTGYEDLQHAPRLAATADPWPGGIAIYRQESDATFTPIQVLDQQAVIGETLTTLYAGPVNRWDRGNNVRVKLYRGALSSVTELNMLNSALALGIRNTNGDWEVIQFASATLVSTGVYDLKTFLRGQLGTEAAMMNPYPVGSRIVLLEPANMFALNVSSDIATTPLVYRWGPSRYPVTDTTYVQATKNGRKTGLRPYSPSQFKAHRTASTGDLTITWKRRTRYGGDGWDGADVPLNEDTEKYRVEVMTGPGGTVKRTIEVVTTTWTYAAADQVTDFGSAQTTIYVRIAQWGSQYGNYGQTAEQYLTFGSSI